MEEERLDDSALHFWIILQVLYAVQSYSLVSKGCLRGL